MSERRIQCPECMGSGNIIVGSTSLVAEETEDCEACLGEGTIPDRRCKPTPNDRTVERIKAYVEKFPIVRNDEYHNGYNEAIDKIESIIREEAERG